MRSAEKVLGDEKVRSAEKVRISQKHPVLPVPARVL